MRSGYDPVIGGCLRCCIRIGVAGAAITGEHVGDPQFVWRRLMLHHRVDKRHAVGVVAHLVGTHHQARKPVLAFAKRGHTAIGAHPDNSRIFCNVFRSGRQGLLRVFSIGNFLGFLSCNCAQQR